MKKKSILSVLLTVLVILGLFTGCKGNDENFPVTVGGAEITKAPETVAVLSENAASAIYALGYKSYLVGAPSEFLTTELEGVTDLGAAANIDFDIVFELCPDVLIAAGELESNVLESLKLRDITVVVLNVPQTYDEVAPYYEALSKIFLGKERYTEAYDPYISETERALSELKTANSAVNKKVAVFVEEGFVVTGDTLAGQALEKVGITNIAADNTNYMMSAVDIIAADPEVIFCAKGDSEAILKNEAYKDITAIKNAAVYEVDIAALTFAGEGFAAVLQDMSTYLKQ